MVKASANGKPEESSRLLEEFREEAVQMLLDGHSASSVANRLGLASPNLLYRLEKEIPPPRWARSPDAGGSCSPSRRRAASRRARA